MLLDKKHQKISLLTGWGLAFLLLAQVAVLLIDRDVALANKVVPSEFGSNRFEGNWQRTDLPIVAQKVSRSWYWGPGPLAGGFYEDYADSPFRTRLVQYFDKARMELNNSEDGNVTNGLLVVEMITGRPQVGDNTFLEREPATVPVAGDLDNAFPTYRDLKHIYNQSLVDRQIGGVVNEKLLPSGGTADFNEYRTDPAARIVRVDNGLGIPAAFWEYLNRSGLIYQQGRYSEGVISDWLFSTGHPITEAYWTRVRVAGVEKDVMFQAFERRLLTYTPANELAYRVEMGNVGLQYAQWRYGGKLPQFSNPLESLFSNTVIQPEWYTSLEVLNIRTAPTSKASKPENTPNKPYVQQLQPGDNVLVVRSVAGEELLKGNNIWFQIYEKPDLFVYSAYVKKAVVPDYPNPPRRHSGLWVSVSTGKQMMAVYNGKSAHLQDFGCHRPARGW